MTAERLDRVCVVMLSSVGGTIWTLPVLNALKRHAPDTHITWVAQPGPASLVRGHPAVDEIIPFERKRGWRGFRAVRGALQNRRFDVSLTLQVYFKAGLVTSFVDAPVKLGFDRARTRDLSWVFTNRRLPPQPLRHMQDQFLEFLPAIGVPAASVEWKLGPWPSERAWQQRFYSSFERPAAAIVVGSTDPERDWIAERWAEVANALRHDFDVEPVLVGGRSPAELRTEAIMRERLPFEPRSTLGCPLRELVGILDGAAVVLSLNTGPLHMAVALDRPVIALLGHLNPKRFGPYRRFHDLWIDAYGDPGEEYPVSMEKRPGRMSRIQVRDVLDRVERWRQRYAVSSGPKT